MNQPAELTALRQKLSAIEAEIDAGRRAMIGIETHNGALAGLRSDCLKAISRLTLAKPEPALQDSPPARLKP